MSNDGHPLDIPNPYDTIDGFAKVIKEFQLTRPPTFYTGESSFDVSARYFEIVADAVQALRDGLEIEMIVGDVMSNIPRLLQCDTATRRELFSKKFTRMRLSNVRKLFIPLSLH